MKIRNELKEVFLKSGHIVQGNAERVENGIQINFMIQNSKIFLLF